MSATVVSVTLQAVPRRTSGLDLPDAEEAGDAYAHAEATITQAGQERLIMALQRSCSSRQHTPDRGASAATHGQPG